MYSWCGADFCAEWIVKSSSKTIVIESTSYLNLVAIVDRNLTIKPTDPGVDCVNVKKHAGVCGKRERIVIDIGCRSD